MESAKKTLLPRITLTAAGGTSSPALTELIDPRAVAWNLAMGLVHPLFTGDRLKVVDAELRLHIRHLEVLRNEPERILVKNGLNAGDRIVTSGIQVPVEGMKVRVE